MKNKYGVALIGMGLLALFLGLFGYFSEQSGTVTGWQFYMPVGGIVLSIIIIFLGLVFAKRRV